MAAERDLGMDEARNVFTVDVEDWYQGIEIPISQWDQYEQRLQKGMDKLLHFMSENNVRSTCFILGKVAEEHPEVVRKIHAAGHEVASHGYTHTKVYDLTRTAFRDEVRHSKQLLEDLTGEEVVGFRAPYFSITKSSLWALDVLASEGYLYDASIHPVRNPRYGIPDAPRVPHVVELADGGTIVEIPVSTLRAGRLNLPLAGGAYLRILPLHLVLAAYRWMDRKGEPLRLYIHPWELDPAHPRIPLPHRVALTHYWNLSSTAPKLRRIMQSFDFVPFREAYASLLGSEGRI